MDKVHLAFRSKRSVLHSSMTLGTTIRFLDCLDLGRSPFLICFVDGGFFVLLFTLGLLCEGSQLNQTTLNWSCTHSKIGEILIWYVVPQINLSSEEYLVFSSHVICS